MNQKFGLVYLLPFLRAMEFQEDVDENIPTFSVSYLPICKTYGVIKSEKTLFN